MVSAVKRKSIEARAVGNEDSTNSDTGMASKKPRSSATSSSSTSPAGAASAAPTTTKEDQKSKLLSQLRVGSRIEVWWTGDKKYYPGTVASKIPGGGDHEYYVNYDDGDHHDLDLKEERFRMIKGGGSSKLPSSLTDSDLVVPDEVDTTKLPDGWEGIVRAELKACGFGADEDYQRQLEAYDSSDDDAGEPPTPPPTRKRMGYARAAVHYKISHSAANILVKIVDVNLERAGIDTSRSIFSEDDDRLIKSLYETELRATGNDSARKDFWEEVAEEHFPGRGLTARAICDRYGKAIAKRISPKTNGAERTSVETSQSKFEDDDGYSGGGLTDADFNMMARLVERELRVTNGDRVRNGFWGKVLKDHFAGRGFTAEQLRQYHKNTKRRQMKVTKDAKKTKSGDLFTDAEDTIICEAVLQYRREHGSEKLPCGFWPSVVNKFSMRRDAQQLSRRWYVLRKSKAADANAGIDMPRQSSSELTTAVAVNGEDQEMSSGSGKEEQPALPGGFTDEEYQSMERLVREELKMTGNERVRPGFWDRVLQKSFSDRNMTSKALCKCYSKIKSLKMAEKSTAESTCKKKTSSSESFADEKDGAVGHSEIMLKDADFKLMQELVRKELEETNCDRVRHGFWGEVVKDHFAGHNLTADQLSGRYRKYKQKKLAAASNDVSDTCNEATSTHEAKNSGENFTADEDAIIIKEAMKEMRDHGKLRSGFWPKVVEKHMFTGNRTRKQLSNRWTTLKSKASDGPSSKASDGPCRFSHEDDCLMERLFKEELKETGTGKARLGFWGKVVDEHFSGRDFDAKALSSRFCYLKSKGKIDLSASTSSEIESAASEPELNLTSDAEDETIGIEVAIDSDTVPLTDDLIMLPAYQATAAQYPPQSRVVYRSSSGESSIFGSVVEVGIYPDQDNLYVYTIGDDAGDQHERIPERFIEKMT